MKRWIKTGVAVAGAGLVAAAIWVGVGYWQSESLGGRFGDVEVIGPTDRDTEAARALVILLAQDSDSESVERQAARRIAAQGALVAVVDLDDYASVQRVAETRGCGILAGDLGYMAKQLLRREDVQGFLLPVLAGTGAGGVLAHQAVAAAMPETVAGAVVDGGPAETGVQLPDCATGQPAADQGFLYTVQPSSANPARAPDPAGVGQAAQALMQEEAVERLAQAVIQHLSHSARGGFAGLPVVELHKPGSERMALFISGDGGWRDIDQQVGAELVQRGISALGWDALRYFWKTKTPEQTAADVARVLAEYRQRWQVREVALIGYSFGADVMPFIYQRLPEEQRQSVRFVSLLGLAGKADFHIRVGGWLGIGSSDGRSTLEAMAHVPAARVQCVYGREDVESACPQLAASGASVLETAGGHHFDGDHARLTERIIEAWDRTPPLPASGGGTAAR